MTFFNSVALIGIRLSFTYTQNRPAGDAKSFQTIDGQLPNSCRVALVASWARLKLRARNLPYERQSHLAARSGFGELPGGFEDFGGVVFGGGLVPDFGDAAVRTD